MNKTWYRCSPIFAAAALAGCAPSSHDRIRESRKNMASQGVEMKVSARGIEVAIWRDPDTGREYVVVGTVNGVGITPRLPKE